MFGWPADRAAIAEPPRIRAIGPAAAEGEDDELLTRYASTSFCISPFARSVSIRFAMSSVGKPDGEDEEGGGECGDLEEEVAAA